MKYVRMVECTAEGDGVRVEMLGDDQERHRFLVSNECAKLLGASLTAQVEKLGLEGKDQQLIRPKGMQTARTDQGEPMVLMTLEGGAELPLVFKPESLTVLISELENLLRAVQPGSQMRWR